MYNLKIITSGNRVELYRVNNYIIRSSYKEDKKVEELKEKENVEEKEWFEYAQEGFKEMKELEHESKKQTKKDRLKTLNNSRNNIIRLIKANEDMQTFITLTFSKEHDYKESKKLLNNLFNKLRRKYKDLKYIWVLEYGEKNNRLHYHLLCNIPIDIKLSSSKQRKSRDHKQLENEFIKKYWKYGFVDIRSLIQEDNTNVALYVATYICKSMEERELEGYRVYGYSNKTLNKPEEIKIYTKDSLEQILKGYSTTYDIRYANSYSIGYEDYKGEHIGTVNYIDLEPKINNKGDII